jgi:hypothetical protein
MIAASYNFIEKYNQLAGIDGRLSLSPNTFFNFRSEPLFAAHELLFFALRVFAVARRL